MALIRFVFIKYLIMARKTSSVCCHQNLCFLTWSPVPVLPGLHIWSLSRFIFFCFANFLTSGLVLFPSRNNWTLAGSSKRGFWWDLYVLYLGWHITMKNPFSSSFKKGVFSALMVTINKLLNSTPEKIQAVWLPL